MSTTRATRAVLGTGAAVVLLAGCGVAGASSSDPTSSAAAPVPTEAITPPAGVTLTVAGSRLAFGQPATVSFAQNAQRRTTLRLTVGAVKQGRAADLAAYSLDEQARLSTPYYASVTVANLGPGDVARASVPLWGVASDGTLVAASVFSTPLRQCASSSLPSPFATGASAATCQVYLVPQGTTLTALSSQPTGSEKPVTWRGKLAVTVPGKPRATASPVR